MANIQYVGGRTHSWAGNASGDTTISLSGTLTGGLASSPSAGDVVIVAYSVGSTADRALVIKDPGGVNYPNAVEIYANGTSYDSNLRGAIKYLTAADASVVCGPSGNAADAAAVAIHVWRGVDPSVFSATTTSATGTGTGQPNPPAITPTDTGAVIVVIGGGAAATGAVYTTATLSNFRTVTQVDTNDAMVGMGSFAWTSGSYDPAVFGGGTTGAGDSWTAITVALKPLNHVTTGALNAGSADITGSANHVTVHGTSGTLESGSAAVAGTALHSTLHSTSGDLTVGSAIITGDAARAAGAVSHSTSGALSAGDSVVVGSAARTRIHPTDGNLIAGTSTVVGAAARTREHSTSGTLSVGVASITGTAVHNIPHTTSGVLDSGSATIAGAAARSTGAVAHDVSGSLLGDGAIIEGISTLAGSSPETPQSGGGGAGGRVSVERKKAFDKIFDFAVVPHEVEEVVEEIEAEIEAEGTPTEDFEERLQAISKIYDTSEVASLLADYNKLLKAYVKEQLRLKLEEEVRLKDEEEAVVMLLLLE